MSEMREQFEKARKAYRQESYLGNLASDVLGEMSTGDGSVAAIQGRSWKSIYLSISSLAAMAAMVVIVMKVGFGEPRANPTVVVVEKPNVSERLIADGSQLDKLQQLWKLDHFQNNWPEIVPKLAPYTIPGMPLPVALITL